MVDTFAWIDLLNNHGSTYIRRFAPAIEDDEQIGKLSGGKRNENHDRERA